MSLRLSILASPKFRQPATNCNLDDRIIEWVIEHNIDDLAVRQSDAGLTRAKSPAQHGLAACDPAIARTGRLIEIAVDLVINGAEALPPRLVHQHSAPPETA